MYGFRDLYLTSNQTSISYDIKIDSKNVGSDFRLYYKNKSNQEMKYYTSEYRIPLSKVISKGEWKTNVFSGKLKYPYVLYHFRIDFPRLEKNTTIHIRNLRINGELITDNRKIDANNVFFTNLKIKSSSNEELQLLTEANKYSTVYLKSVYNIKSDITINYLTFFLLLAITVVLVSNAFKFKIFTNKDIDRLYLLSICGIGITLPFSKYTIKQNNIKSHINKLLSLNFISFTLFTILFTLIYAYTFDFTIKEYFNSDFKNCYNKIFQNQFPVFITLYLIVLFGSISCNKILKAIVLLVALFFNCWIFADIFTYLTFDTHFQFSYLWEYKNDFAKSNDIAVNFFLKNINITLLFVTLLIIQYYIVMSVSKKQKLNKIFPLIWLLVICLIYFITPCGQISIYESKYFSIFQAQEDNLNVKYTNDYIYNKYSPRIIDVTGLNQKKNIIIVFVESFSSSQSKLFSGLNNNTPNFDKIASEYTIFPNYYSNSWNTTAANFSLLNTLPYLNGTNYLTAKFNAYSFPKALKNYGNYSTNVIFSAENTGALDKVWEASGIENYYSGELPYYNKSERLTFNSVPDMDLFNFVIEKTSEQQKSKQPFFNLVMTTTTHGPYRVPGTNSTEQSYEKTIQYVDNSLSKLYKKLVDINYFDNGILIITGDHRAMLPVSSQEVAKYGFRAIARVPCVIIGKGFEKQVYNENFSHTMLSNYLAFLNLPHFKTYETPNLYFPSKNNDTNNQYNIPKPVIFQVNSPADNAIVVYNEKEYLIKYNGDKTTIEGNLPQPLKEELLKEIYFIRSK